MKSGNLNFLEPSGPFQACNGAALPFTLLIRLVTLPTELTAAVHYLHSKQTTLRPNEDPISMFLTPLYTEKKNLIFT